MSGQRNYHSHKQRLRGNHVLTNHWAEGSSQLVFFGRADTVRLVPHHCTGFFAATPFCTRHEHSLIHAIRHCWQQQVPHLLGGHGTGVFHPGAFCRPSTFVCNGLPCWHRRCRRRRTARMSLELGRVVVFIVLLRKRL